MKIDPRAEGKRLLSNSSRNAFTFCPRSFELNYLVGLKRKLEQRPLSVGTAIHKALLAHYTGASEFEIEQGLAEWRDGVKAQIARLQRPEYTAETVDADHALAVDMVTRYLDRYPADASEYEVLAVEEPFIVPIVQKVGDALRVDANYAYTGVFDLVVRRRATGQVLVIDHKTTTLTDLAAYERDVETGGAGQRIGYVYAARFFWPGVGGLVYNVMRKKAPSKVQTVQCKRCKGAGCDACHGTGYAGLSKTIPDTMATRYQSEVAALVARNPSMSQEGYPEALAELQQRTGHHDRFLYRFSLAVSDRDIEEWCADIYDVAHAMGRALKVGKWYRNLTACSVNGRRCPYLPVCMRGWDNAENWRIEKRDPWRPAEVALNNEDEEE